jgi:uncharacterized membrane protein
MNSAALSLASLVVGPVEFDRPAWLIIIPIAWIVIVLLARRSLAGLDQGWRIAAVVVRLLVVGLLLAAIAEPSWRKESTDRTVLAVLDVSESVPRELQAKVEAYIERGANADEFKDKKLGFVTTARDALPGQLASKLNRAVAYEHQGKLDATDIAAGLRLAIAIMPRDAGNRLLLATDGNQTAGDVIQAANAAAALGIPIDVIPLKYEYTGEVMLDKLIAPATAREGETLTVRVVLQASAPTEGRLNLLLNGDQIDLDPASEAQGVAVSLREGQNVLQVPVPARRSGPQQFEAVFEPTRSASGSFEGDTLAQNNRSSSVTFVEGEGRVLVLGNPQSPLETAPLMEALQQARIRTELRDASNAPQTLTDMSAFDAIVLVNQSADNFTQAQQEGMRQYVNDTGGGLVMIGGPTSFGAGGWIGSPLEEALPLRLDPPQKRQMPRGALVICVHSVEMPNGVFYGKRVCEAAVNRLSRLDLVGINEFSGWGGNGNTGHRWVYDLKPVGDGSEVKRAIESLTFGDMQDFTPSFQLSYDSLEKAQAGQKHMIVISDGDPSPPPDSLLRKFVAARISVSTVGVFPHSGLDTSRMQEISRLTGGRHYEVNTDAALAKLPEIFVKEAMTVRRSLIFEAPGAGLPVAMFGGMSETMRGIAGVPNVNGYVVTAEREGLALVTAKLNATKDNPQGDPLLAQWQYGLGRVIAYTSDATTKWNPQWTSWANYRQFWEQHMRWALRPQGSNNVRVVTENRGDGTLINVEAFDTAGERLSFANFRGRLARPDGSGVDVTLQQVAPGRYQATVPTELSGNYVMSLRYAASDENVEGGVLEGSVQAAISRPFADEYRVLRDNTALLMQVAQITGGRVLSLDEVSPPQAPLLWSDEGVELPVARTPIWLAVTLAALVLFLLDVAVRRVRADFAAMKKWVLGAFAKRQAANAQLGGLRAAREQARERIKLRSEQGGQQLSESELAAQAKREVQHAQQVASKKFEASAEDLQAARTRDIAQGGSGAMPSRQPTKPADDARGKPSQAGSEAAGMDRLMKAKRKAREDIDDIEKP